MSCYYTVNKWYCKKHFEELTHRITMNDVSVVEIGHENDTSEGEDKDCELFVIRPSLLGVQKRPYHVVDF